MLKAGIHSAFSTNWKSWLEASKPNHRSSETRKVSSEVHSAVQRALRAPASLSPRTKRKMRTAPRVGRNVTTERIGKWLIVLAPDGEEIPGDDQHQADQHGEGVVVDVAGLQPRRAPRQRQRRRGEAVRPEPVDQGPVASLP